MPADQPAARQTTRVTHAVVLAVFALATAGAGIWDLIHPAPARELVGAERDASEERRAAANLWDGSLADFTEERLDERSNVQRHLVPYYTAGLVRLLREGQGDVVVGADGWLFLASRARAPEHPPAELGALGAAVFAAYERRLALFGVRMLLAPVPRRAVVCGRWLPPSCAPDPGLEDAFLDSLAARGVAHVDPRATFADMRPEEVFYRQDTHWTREAQLATARALARAAGVLADSPVGALDPAARITRAQGLLMSIGVPVGSPAALRLLPGDTAPELLPRGDDLQALLEPAVMPRLAIVGTSFTDGELLVRYLAHVSGEPIWNGARRGRAVRETLAQFLRRNSAALPRDLFVEYPTFQLERQRFVDGTVRLSADELAPLQALRPRELSSLGPLPLVPRPDRVRGSLPILDVPAGALASEGDGALYLRLRGARGADPVRVSLAVGPLRLVVPWGARQKLLLLPLLGTARGAPAVRVTLAGAGCAEFELDSIDVVSEYDLEAGARGTAGSPVVDGGGWELTFTFDPPVTPARHAALHVRGALSAELELNAGTARAFGELQLSDPGAMALLSLGPASEGPLRALVLRGTGAPPDPPDVRLVGLPERD